MCDFGSLKNLWCFYKVVKEGGFSKAARAECKTQPAISFAVSALEKQLGVKLIERSGKIFRLTDAGRKAFEIASELFETVDRSMIKLKEISSARFLPLKIAATSLVTHEFVLDALEAFKTSYPMYVLDLHEAPTKRAIKLVEDKEVEFAIVGETNFPPNFIIRFLTTIEFLLVIPSKLKVDFYEHPPSLFEFKDVPFVLPQKDSSVRELLDKLFSSIGFEPNVCLEATNHYCLKRAIIDGMGVGFLTFSFVKQEFSEGKVFVTDIKEGPILKKVYFIYAKKELSQPARDFKDFLVSWTQNLDRKKRTFISC